MGAKTEEKETRLVGGYIVAIFWKNLDLIGQK
jgi:hypothetical protein